MPYRSRADQPRDLIAQIEDELRDRLREAIDHVGLEVLVETRRAEGRAHPAADSEIDRAEFEANVRSFLDRLDREVTAAAPGEVHRTLAGVRARAGHDPIAARLGVQVALARALPDYWQRFEVIRHAYTADLVPGDRARGRSGHDPGNSAPAGGSAEAPPLMSLRGLLRQLFGRR